MKFFRVFTLPLSIIFFFLFGLSIFIDRLPVDAGGVNRLSKPIALREEADDSLSAVGYLEPEAFAVIENNKAERWVYIYYQDKILTVPRVEFSDGYVRTLGLVMKEDVWGVLVINLTELRFIILIFAVILMFLSLFNPRSRKKKNKRRNNKQDDVAQPVMTYSRDRDIANKKVPIEEVPPSYVFDRNKTYDSLPNDEKRKELEAKVIERLKEKIHLEYRGKIVEMEIAAEEIRQEFETAQKNALILGVDLKDSNLDNLVKGRLFEVYGAKYWHDHSKLTILDWTPDKGFQHNIDVKSNGNPDFLLEVNNEGEKIYIAIECKYRNNSFRWNPDKKGARPFCAFEERYKIERYRNYGLENNYPVCILLGVGDSPDKPEDLYLVPVSTVLELDATEKWGRLSMEAEKLKKYKISPDDFYLRFVLIAYEFKNIVDT